MEVSQGAFRGVFPYQFFFFKMASTGSFRRKVSHPAARQSSAAGWPTFDKTESRQVQADSCDMDAYFPPDANM